MDFGDILTTWEADPEHAHTVNKDATATEAAEHRSNLRNSRKMLPEASIDLHGMTKDEAWAALESFVTSSCAQGFRKISIVHGKGNHPGSDGALYKMVSGFIECDKRLGASSHPDARHGGSGATWVTIKGASMRS
jgi:DNA-nicking Smr family endonuclease